MRRGTASGGRRSTSAPGFSRIICWVELDGLPIQAPMDGFLRGIARDGVHAALGVKLVEIDPRGRASNWTGTDERGRAIAEAVVRAIAESPAGGRRPSRTRVTLH